MHRIILIVLVSFFSVSAFAEGSTQGHHSQGYHHPILPMLMGAALITWGAYELGSDTEESQRNVNVLWGGAALISTGLVLYQSSNRMGSQVAVRPLQDVGASVAYSYRF